MITGDGFPDFSEELVFIQDLSHGEVTKLGHEPASNSMELDHEAIHFDAVSWVFLLVVYESYSSAYLMGIHGEPSG
jgi:hypothetical protein